MSYSFINKLSLFTILPFTVIVEHGSEDIVGEVTRRTEIITR